SADQLPSQRRALVSVSGQRLTEPKTADFVSRTLRGATCSCSTIAHVEEDICTQYGSLVPEAAGNCPISPGGLSACVGSGNHPGSVRRSTPGARDADGGLCRGWLVERGAGA